MKYPPSELPINADGSAFHLHLTPDHLADKVILVGDPDRASVVASHFDSIEFEVLNREFHAVTGTYHGKRLTVQSHGIGCDNMDIVITELDALANINFQTREDNPEFRQLSLVRIGTCGGLHPFTPVGSFIASVKSIGFDGLLNYYADRNKVCDLELEEAFKKHMDWSPLKGAPYCVTADPELVDKIAGPVSSPLRGGQEGPSMIRGITIACGGFYGPQGRQIRLKIQDPDQNAKVESFVYPPTPNTQYPTPLRICNIEMESSALAGLAAMLGHKAMTCCMVLANRYNHQMDTEYKNSIDTLIKLVLDRI